MNEIRLERSEKFEVVTRPHDLANSLQDQMVAMGKALLKAKKSMTVNEYKGFIMALTKMKWAKEGNSNIVELSKIEICEVMGWELNGSDRSTRTRALFKSLVKHSWIAMDGETEEEWDDGFLFTRMRSTRGSIILYFGEQFMPLLENLLKDRDFVTIWANDIYKFDSTHAYMLFEELRLHSDTTKTNWRTYTTRELKEIFGIPKDGEGSYMRSEEQGGFNRTAFEKKVLDKAILEINKGQMIQILPFLECVDVKRGKFYEKIKKNGYVAGYRFKYIVKTRVVTTPVLEQEEDELDRIQTKFTSPEDLERYNAEWQNY